tara:strand:- start:23 stop:478 length:456 start_codon:yes stop_codon:yes gene_type:complete
MKSNVSDEEIKSPLIGKSFPKINIVEFGKIENIDFNKYKNKNFAINFFASWCLPCKIEAPLLNELSSKIDIIGISYKDNKTGMVDFLKNYGNPYKQIGIDKSGSIAIEWGVYGVPETFIINNNGNIIFKHTGPINHDNLNNKIIPLISKND